MTPIKSDADVFRVIIRQHHLSPAWRQLQMQMQINNKNDWSYYAKFAAYCTLHEITVEKADEAAAAAFLAAAPPETKECCEGKAARIRTLNARYKTKNPSMVLPPLGPPAKRKTPRRDQFGALPPNFQKELESLRKIFGKNWISTENLILRMIALAEENGCEIKNFSALFEVATLRRLDAANWGVPGIKKWTESPLARQYRYLTLQAGRRWSEAKLRDEALANRLGTYIDKMDAPNERHMPDKIENGARQFEDPAFAAKIQARCRTIIGSFYENPSSRAAPPAEDAAGVLLQMASAQVPSCIVKTAKFSGAARKIPGSPKTRRLITLTRASTEIGVEERLKEETRQIFDRLWLGLCAAFGRAPSFVFEKKDGTIRSGSAYTLGCEKLFQPIGICLSPKMIDTGAYAAMHRAGMSLEDMAKTAGVAQVHNLETRIKDFTEDDIAQKFADSVCDGDDDHHDTDEGDEDL